LIRHEHSDRQVPFEPGWTIEPPPPSQLNPEADDALDRIIMRSMSKDPEARQATAGEFASELDRWIAVHQPA